MMKRSTGFLIAVLVLAGSVQALSWEVDFSRRKNSREMASEQPAAATAPAPEAATQTVEAEPLKIKSKEKRLESFVSQVEGPVDRQEFVIVNTPSGFIPRSIRLRNGTHYTAHVVNINDSKKNVSFILDGFAQHHATFFGKKKSFFLDPKVDGVYEFVCPETSARGEIIVFGGKGPQPINRNLSAE